MIKQNPLALGICFILAATLYGRAPEFQVEKSMEKLLDGRLKKEDFPLPSHAIELTTSASFPSVEKESEGLDVVEPRGFAQDEDGRIYIADMTRNEAMIFDQAGMYIKSFGRSGQGPGEFLQPWHLLTWNGRILVSDTGNRRIQFFDRDGRYLDKGFKLSKGYQSLGIDSNGEIYGAPIYYKYPSDADSRLIDVMDQSGRIIRSFGDPIMTRSNFDYSSLSAVKISIDRKTNGVWVAFEKFATVRKYSTAGELLGEFEVPNLIMKKTAELNRTRIAMRAASNPVPYAIVQAAIFADEDGLYSFVPSPIIEIVHIGKDGKLKELFWRDKGEDLYLGGLAVRKQRRVPAFFLIRRSPQAEIDSSEKTRLLISVTGISIAGCARH
jgi:6-bladed beta-propeller